MGRAMGTPPPWGQGVFCREKVIHEAFVDGDRVGCTWQGGESRSLPRGDEVFGRPDSLRGYFGEEVSPVGYIGPWNGFKVPQLGLLGNQ